jgi:hypothetical protein
MSMRWFGTTSSEIVPRSTNRRAPSVTSPFSGYTFTMNSTNSTFCTEKSV